VIVKDKRKRERVPGCASGIYIVFAFIDTSYKLMCPLDYGRFPNHFFYPEIGVFI
jgi:hypothetical protein